MAAIDPELSYSFGQEDAPDGLQVVERGNTGVRKPLIGPERDLRGYASGRSGDWRDHDGMQDRDCLASGDDQDRSSLVLGLCPPNIALGGNYHGSSAIMATVASSDQPPSASVGGMAS